MRVERSRGRAEGGYEHIIGIERIERQVGGKIGRIIVGVKKIGIQEIRRGDW